ncbi:uncharacterized protein LOC131217193 isoform X2 [Magnolia sinica]|uniref:uncharacterized protein LOC131217193 isoform X2 n=1 Tax=Magnolia sinica TaxID=86752 RepID=UPI00265B70D3|nr:uncharacterized protein LOC131217193 isoform X2 [Magnolia sinica]
MGIYYLLVMLTYVIIYEPPTFGIHHFSLSSWNSSEHAKTPFKRPKWVDELYQKQPFSDLDIVFLALNSASAAKAFFEGSLGPRSSFQQFPIISMLVAVAWRSIAMFVASFFTFFYVILHVCHGFLSNASLSSICMVVEKVFSHTWKNVHIRSCQLLYWPISLQGSGSRLKSSVEYAHRAALRHHSIWSSIFIDVLLGNVVGWALLLYREAVYFWILHLVGNVTNNLLRSGCVWLMGVPAGFKLNTELARVLGMLSLNAIQIWSTLWFFIGFLFRHFIKGLAISGIVLGATIPAALCIDMLKLATLHLSTLHWLISLLYSQQIQALASLWRLFRGLKWNPLRQRLDSYDYTVEQHVVGSLIFTPILLLLPTSSVFYIFFTIMNAMTSFICILIEVAISVLHATPYAEIFLRMVRPRRFPSGIWFEIILGQNSNMPAPKLSFSNEDYSPSAQERMAEKNDKKGSGDMVSVLRSNFATLGQVILPHYRNAFRGVSLSSAASSAYGVLSGQRIPSSLGTGFPSTMPWFSLSFKQYWRLCRDSVLAVRSDP